MKDDAISRKAVLKLLAAMPPEEAMTKTLLIQSVKQMDDAHPERTCVNCGRTANNGGWYADGRTRCPIEEHYALPKDGHCHLWEKRNVTDDDYPERRTDGEIIPE